MAQPWAEKFYSSEAWHRCRASYMKKAGGLCEICAKKGLIVPAEIVHHRTPITPTTVNDPEITLNFSNLCAVCRNCHAELHSNRPRRYQVDKLGRVIAKD